MAARKDHRKLGGRYAFLKRRLLRLPQSLRMEVDFCPLAHIPGVEYAFWLGLVVDHHSGSILMETMQEQPPTVEDIADLLAAAMERPIAGVPCRPEVVLLRDNPEWEGLLPFLDQLGIDTLVTEDLLCWDATSEELMDWIRFRFPRLPKVLVESEEERVAVFETLCDLRGIAYWFVPSRHAKDK